MVKDSPNIILIVCDTLGAKHMSLYGYERQTTPNLEKLVEEEGFIVYTKCFAPAPWTSPSHASLFTGLYPSEHGTNDYNLFLDEKIYTLAEVLKHTGYITIGLSNNYLISKDFGYDRGFDEFYELMSLFPRENFYDIVKKIFYPGEKWKKLWNLINNWSSFKKQKLIKFLLSKVFLKVRQPLHNTTPYTQRTLKLARKIIEAFSRSEEKFFLFINLMQTHAEYNPPKKFRNVFEPTKKILSYKNCLIKNYCGDKRLNVDQSIEYWKARYDEEVLFLDWILCSFYKELKELGLLKNTMVVITSDHGELFGEMGHLEHIFTTYNSLIHIPLLIKFGDFFKNNFDVDERIVQLHDIFGTIIDIICSPFPKPRASFSLVSSEKRSFAISQHIGCRNRVKFFLKKCPDWNFKIHNFVYSNMALLTELNNILYKLIYYSNGHMEVYKLLNGLYEEKNITYSQVNEAERIELEGLHKLLVDKYRFTQSLPEDERKLSNT